MDVMNKGGSSNSFNLTLKWSVGLFLVFILIGFLFRWVSPTELHLDASVYEEKAFVTDRIEVWGDTSDAGEVAGFFEPGSIIYVLEMNDQWALVRPLRISGLDSVWVNPSELSLYDEEIYKEWSRQYERNVVRELQGSSEQ